MQTVVISTVTNVLLWSAKYGELQNKTLELITFIFAYILLGLLFQLTSCSHSTSTLEQTKYTEHIKPSWQVPHPLHQTVQEAGLFCTWLMLLGWWLTLISIKHLHVWNQDHLIYDQLVAVCQCLLMTAIYISHQIFIYIHFRSGGPIHINTFIFLTPPMQPAWPHSEGWDQQTLVQSWCPANINLSKTEP